MAPEVSKNRSAVGVPPRCPHKEWPAPGCGSVPTGSGGVDSSWAFVFFPDDLDWGVVWRTGGNWRAGGDLAGGGVLAMKGVASRAEAQLISLVAEALSL